MRYTISPEAVSDLEGIWQWVAERSNPQLADRFLAKFEQAFLSLASSPAIGVAVTFPAPKGTRKFPVGNYLIYYLPVGSKRIVVARVLHGKRLQARALRKKPGA
jgi:toxin ParE1/3/4